MISNRDQKKLSEDEIPSGCDTMKILWKAAGQCYLDKPGINGTPRRVNNFINCSNIYPFLRIAALKCWEERTEVSSNPSALFTPLDLSDNPTKTNQPLEINTDEPKNGLKK